MERPLLAEFAHQMAEGVQGILTRRNDCYIPIELKLVGELKGVEERIGGKGV
jgi:hypothetical protein